MLFLRMFGNKIIDSNDNGKLLWIFIEIIVKVKIGNFLCNGKVCILEVKEVDDYDI